MVFGSSMMMFYLMSMCRVKFIFFGVRMCRLVVRDSFVLVGGGVFLNL